MQKAQAQNLVKETFENPFNEEKLRYFLRNLLNHFDEENKHSYSGQFISTAFQPYISTLKRIGKYSENEHEIDILVVQLKKESSLERARTAQRNFIARYLNGSRGGEMKDAALVAFVSPNDEDWRFSLVKMDYKFDEKGKVKEEFNIETVTKEFFKEYRDLFIKTKKELDKVVNKDPKLKTEFETKCVDTV